MTTSVSPTSVNQLNILYVEDNDLVRDITAVLIEETSHKVVAVENAEEALDAFAKQKFDVLFTDVSLPTISGIELAKKIREIEPETWLVISSGYAWKHGLEQFGKKTISLPKPFEIDELEKVLGQISES